VLFGVSLSDSAGAQASYLVNSYTGSSGATEYYCRAGFFGSEDLQSLSADAYDACDALLDTFVCEQGLSDCD